MKRSPSALRSTAPSKNIVVMTLLPRSAAGATAAEGSNCTNSMSQSDAPAPNAMAMPSPPMSDMLVENG